MPRNFASKGFTVKLFPRNCKVGVRRPFTSTSVACLRYLKRHFRLKVVNRSVVPNSCGKASLTVQPLQLSEFNAAWYSDLVRTQLDKGIKIEEVKVDMRLFVVKPLSSKCIIKAVDEVASCL